MWKPAPPPEPCIEVGCGKIRGEGHDLCPKHLLLQTSAAGERSRRAQRSAATRQRNADARKALETSPLRGYNPEYGR